MCRFIRLPIILTLSRSIDKPSYKSNRLSPRKARVLSMRLPPALKRLPRLHLFCHFLLPFLLFLRPESTESLILRSPLCSVGGRVRILQTKIYFSFTVSYRRTTAARPAPGPALLPPELPRPCRSLASSWRRPTRRRRPKPSIARPWPPDLPLVPR